MTVEELRKSLVELGLSQDEANAIKGKAALEAKLEELEEQPFGVEIEQEEDAVVEIVEVITPTHPKWKEKVMSEFDAADEIFNGSPTVDGLRRVTEKVMGPIIESNAKVVQAPNRDNGYHAVVEHEIVIRRIHNLEDGEAPYNQIVTEVADVRTDEDNMFSKYSAGYASTRAEGRALRKLLRLRKIVAAEEIDENSQMAEAEYSDDVKIGRSLCVAINLLAQQIDIDVWDLIKSSSDIKLNSPKDIPATLAKEVFAYLNRVKRKEKGVEFPEDFRGFKPLNLD